VATFEEILSRIARGEGATSSELVPYLSLGGRAHRENVNTLLAGAYAESGRAGDLAHARVFVRRAWLLGRFPPALLPLYTRIHAALGDVAGIRDAYKRAGIEAAARGDLAEALRHFDAWQYADFYFSNLDRYEYDFDILNCLDGLARPHRLAPHPRAGLRAGGKIRVAYLVKGVTEVGSVLVKINLLFARLHDRARVEPLFFAPESERAVLDSEAGREHLRLFESHGCELTTGPNVGGARDRLLAVARSIHDARPDVLITSAALAQFEHYFIAALRPAPFVVGLVQGPPQQFAPPSLDWSVAWSGHTLIDCPVDCVRVPLRGELAEREKITPYDRSELGIPEGALVVASAGRHVKFQEPAFWRAVLDLLEQFPHVHYLVLGPEQSQISFLPPMLSPETGPRVHFLSWRDDSYLRALCLADVLIDTFPSGGGAVLLDALALGIPPVSFENNYMRLFDQADWSLADEFIKIPELVVPRGDFGRMKSAVARLIDDEEFRRDVTLRARAYTLETRANPALSVRECEDAYLHFIEQKLSGRAAADEREAEVEGLARRRRPPPPSVPAWVGWTARQLKRALRFGESVLDRVA